MSFFFAAVRFTREEDFLQTHPDLFLCTAWLPWGFIQIAVTVKNVAILLVFLKTSLIQTQGNLNAF